MNEQLSVLDSDYSYGISAEERNKVLRNTYWLLALSLVPTVLGAWAGVALGLGRVFSGGLGIVLFLAGAFGFIYAIERTKNSATGVPVLLAFTFFMGITMSRHHAPQHRQQHARQSHRLAPDMGQRYQQAAQHIAQQDGYKRTHLHHAIAAGEFAL